MNGLLSEIEFLILIEFFRLKMLQQSLMGVRNLIDLVRLDGLLSWMSPLSLVVELMRLDRLRGLGGLLN